MEMGDSFLINRTSALGVILMGKGINEGDQLWDVIYFVNQFVLVTCLLQITFESA